LRALHLKLEKIAEIRQKKLADPNYKPMVYDMVTLEEIPEVKLINENWVKVKVKIGAICGSDLHILTLNTSDSLFNFCSFPTVMGHEFVGEIVEKGKMVKEVSNGDRVIVEPTLPCEVREIEPCAVCKEDKYNLCSNLDKGIISPGLLTGLCKDLGGGWGEYAVAHKSRVFKLPDSISFEEAVIIEPLSCSIHAVLKKLPKDNESCVVVGCGTIGLTTILALKALSNSKVIAIAKYPYQSEIAKKLGADKVLLAKKDTHIKKIGRELGCKILSPPGEDALLVGGGADVVIDSVGNASSLSNSIRIVSYQGTVILLGAPANMEIDWTPLLYKEAKIIPSWTYGYDELNGIKQRTFQIALDLVSSGSVNVKEILTHTYPIDQYQEALMVTSNKRENNVIKAAFKFE